MATILVTGGAGFIGSALAKALASNPQNQIVVVDNLATGSLERLFGKRTSDTALTGVGGERTSSGNIKWIKGDVNRWRDISSIFAAFHFDFVFHYAAVVGVQRTLTSPASVLEDIDGIKNILDLAKNSAVRRVFYSSSSEVYGESVEFPQNEQTTPLNSRLPYAVVKNVGEVFCRTYEREFGLPFTIFRFFNTYGPDQSDDFVISRFVTAALAGRDLEVYGDGSQTRTFCFIEDNIRATTNAFLKNLFVNDAVNIGHDRELTVKQLAEVIIEVTGSRSKIRHLPPLAEGDMTRRKPDITKMRELLDRDFTPLEEGIKRIVEARRKA